MKRILIYSTQILPTGGLESHLLEFCKHMYKEGIIIDLIVSNFQAPIATEFTYKEFCRKVFLGRNNSPIIKLLWLLYISAKVITTKYDALYSNGQGQSIYLLNRVLRMNKNWVHHHHTSGDEEDQVTWGTQYLKALRKADTLIACSSLNAKHISGFINRKVDTIPCFSRKISIENSYTIPHGKIKLGYYGRLIPEKGIDLLCQMSNDPDLSEVEFHIWGQGEAYPSSFFTKFPKIHYHNTFMGLSGLKNTLTSLNGVLLLSVHPEGLPISLLEAMSAGLPWLATDRGGIPDIACDPVSTRVISANSNYIQFKQAVLSFAKDIQLGKISRETQEKLYKDNYSASALIGQWKDALNIA